MRKKKNSAGRNNKGQDCKFSVEVVATRAISMLVDINRRLA